MEEQSTPQWGQQYLCAPWWLNVVIVQIEKGALQKKMLFLVLLTTLM